MLVGLASPPLVNGEIEKNFKQIVACLDSAPQLDWICFSESFLQGFDSITDDHTQDSQHFLTLDSPIFHKLSAQAKAHNCGISVGFFEKTADDSLYDTYLHLDQNGKRLAYYRRISRGWCPPNPQPQYKFGATLGIHTFNEKRILTAICGDLWEDDLYARMIAAKAQFDLVVWPLHINYTKTMWENGELLAYARRTADLKCPVLMINTYEDPQANYPNPDGFALGGCYLFRNGAVENSLPLGNSGMLTVEL